MTLFRHHDTDESTGRKPINIFGIFVLFFSLFYKRGAWGNMKNTRVYDRGSACIGSVLVFIIENRKKLAGWHFEIEVAGDATGPVLKQKAVVKKKQFL